MTGISSAATSETRLQYLDLEPSVSPDAGGIAVVFCCASADENVLCALSSEIETLGAAPRVMPGLDLDPYRLILALTRETDPTIFVVCISEALSKTNVRQLVEIFTHHRARHHRLLVLEIENDRPRLLVAAVERTLQSLRRQADLRSAGDSTISGIWRGSADELLDEDASVDGACDQPRAEPPFPGRPRPNLVVIRGGGGTWTVEGRAANDEPATIPATAPLLAEAMTAPVPRRMSIAQWRHVLAAAAVIWAMAILSAIVANPKPEKATLTSVSSVAPASSARGGADAEIEPAVMSAWTSSANADRAGLQQAIAAGEVALAPRLAVTFPEHAEMSGRDADWLCTRQRVHGVAQWRLPTAAEARRVFEAELLRAGATYWTRTRPYEASFTAWGFDANGAPMLAQSLRHTSRVVCVRDLP